MENKDKSIPTWRIGIVGGGAAGLMAAISAALYWEACKVSFRQIKIYLFEKNSRLGEKVRITGHGRCNLTSNQSNSHLIQGFYKNGKFLYSGLNQFSSRDCQDFFGQMGIPLMEEEDYRVFPKSQKAKDVVERLEQKALALGVEIHLNESVIKIVTTPDLASVSQIVTLKEAYDVDSCIFCTGGVTYPKTGSTGDGHELLRQLGHSIVSLKAGLAPIKLHPFSLETQKTNALAGVTLSQVEGKIVWHGKSIATATGGLLFTHQGLTGPCMMLLSRFLASLEYKEDYEMQKIAVVLDFAPEWKADALLDLWREQKQMFPQKQIKNIISFLSNQALANWWLEQAGISGETKMCQIDKRQFLAVIQQIKSTILPVGEGADFDLGMVTVGGVCLKEIHPSTMKSKRLQNLFVAGELLDIDGKTGGYNLQNAWTTGFVAGRSSLEGFLAE